MKCVSAFGLPAEVDWLGLRVCRSAILHSSDEPSEFLK